MLRSILLLAALLLMNFGAAGCRSCQGTNDYCGPLPDAPCDFFYRRNSILGGDMTVETPETKAAPGAKAEENVPTPAPQQQPGGLQYMPSPTPMPPGEDSSPDSAAPPGSAMPPDAALPPESDLPPDSSGPGDSEPLPDAEAPNEALPPQGARIQAPRDPYAYRPQRSGGVLGSLFHWR